MARVQLSLNVSDLKAAVDFYSRLFATRPAKLKPGYANFAIDDPPLKLVLNAPGNGPGATINHLGVEVESAGQVEQATRRLQDAGLSPVAEDEARCCYARQAKVWASDPDGAAWEFYTVLADLDTPDGQLAPGQPAAASELPRDQRDAAPQDASWPAGR